jgi:hypothetical protein
VRRERQRRVPGARPDVEDAPIALWLGDLDQPVENLSIGVRWAGGVQICAFTEDRLGSFFVACRSTHVPTSVTHRRVGKSAGIIRLLTRMLTERLGFAIESMQRRWGAVGDGVLLGAIWGAWHFAPFLQAGRSLEWIAWQSLYLIASRVLLVWIFNNTGRSVFAAALFHATGNLSWQLFPI